MKFFFREEEQFKKNELENLRGKLHDVSFLIANENYDEQVLKPIRDAVQQMSRAYDCQTVEELAYNRGKYEAFMEILDVHRKIDQTIKNIDFELESLK